jgi:alkylation response protein AidB-like acyl-CoA dehydrogenase
MVGPMLMVHGTEEQKERFLPPIARAEVFWCQGFSEPGAGSDLASLQCRAVRDGDDYVLNGQKIWTSNAHKADWIHVLARTDPNAPKHRGISYFLVDMKSPGLSTRPIVNLAGGAGFAETYFEDVRVPARNLIGDENRGWYVGTTTLDFERSGVNYPAEGRRTLDELLAFTKSHPELRQKPGVRQAFAELSIEVDVARWLSYRVAFMQARGMVPNHEASMGKVFGTEMQQRLANFAVNLLGPYGLLQRGTRWTPIRGYLEFKYQWQVSPTIFAGTSEIERNIIATGGLGLPRGS